MRRFYLLTMMMLMAGLSVFAKDYYVSTTGSDKNDGTTRDKALATLAAAQSKVVAGDRVYILPGTYTITEKQVSQGDDLYKIVFNMNQKGQRGKPISFIGLTEDGQRPVFDMSKVNPAGYRITAFYVTGSYLVFRNFEVIGMKANLKDHTQSENFRVRNGSHCTFDNIACHDGMGVGFYLTNNSHHNLFLNCDGYNNYDPVSENGKGGQNDGFGCHVQSGNKNNIFIGCRAWNNSDDGYDLINCHSPVTICYSIAYKNGYDADGTARQDGNGFKAGGYGMGSAVTLPDGGAPRHKVYHCLAVQNKSNGIYSNHHLGGLDFTYNTSVDNRAKNFSMLNRKDATYPKGAVDVNGYGHKLKYNLSENSISSNKHIGNIDATDGQNTLTGNSFSWSKTNQKWVNKYSATFSSTAVDRLKRARKSNGMLAPASTLTVYQQTTYTGMGCDFSGYEDAIKEAKKISGAEEILENTYVSDSRTWDFSDLTDGTVEMYTDYNDLVMRGTSGTHAVTTAAGKVSFAANGANIRDSYLTKDKQAADDTNSTSYDRCLAFNATVPGKTTVTFSTNSDNDSRCFQILFKAKDKDVVKKESPATKAQTKITLTSKEAGTFFIASTIAVNVHMVKFEPTTAKNRSSMSMNGNNITGVQGVDVNTDENMGGDGKTQKYVLNGKLVIEHNNKRFAASGQRIM